MTLGGYKIFVFGNVYIFFEVEQKFDQMQIFFDFQFDKLSTFFLRTVHTDPIFVRQICQLKSRAKVEIVLTGP